MGIQLKVDGKTKGPFSESEILEMVESGSVKPTDLAREKGKIKWKNTRNSETGWQKLALCC